MILSWIFKIGSIAITIGVIVLMTLIATQAILGRVPDSRYSGIVFHTFFSLAGSSWVFSFFAGSLVLPPGSWRNAELILPFAGLLLGNSISGISLGLIHWTRSLSEQREAIETRLAHGANRWEAAQPVFREAVRTAMTPILNSMTVAGVVSLPGMMTGQLISGTDPRLAVQYQIVALFLISASTLVGILLALGMGYGTLFNQYHQLRLQRLISHGSNS
jgi:putative ABC transport system permease protein